MHSTSLRGATSILLALLVAGAEPRADGDAAPSKGQQRDLLIFSLYPDGNPRTLLEAIHLDMVITSRWTRPTELVYAGFESLSPSDLTTFKLTANSEPLKKALLGAITTTQMGNRIPDLTFQVKGKRELHIGKPSVEKLTKGDLTGFSILVRYTLTTDGMVSLSLNKPLRDADGKKNLPEQISPPTFTYKQSDRSSGSITVFIYPGKYSIDVVVGGKLVCTKLMDRPGNDRRVRSVPLDIAPLGVGRLVVDTRSSSIAD